MGDSRDGFTHFDIKPCDAYYPPQPQKKRKTKIDKVLKRIKKLNKQLRKINAKI